MFKLKQKSNEDPHTYLRFGGGCSGGPPGGGDGCCCCGCSAPTKPNSTFKQVENDKNWPSLAIILTNHASGLILFLKLVTLPSPVYVIYPPLTTVSSGAHCASNRNILLPVPFTSYV